MSGTCCGRRAARVTTEVINQSLGDLEASIQDPGAGAGALERDPNCECDPCMCPSDDVPCNARYLGDDLSNQGLQQALDRLVRHARQVQAAQGDGCDCADRPPYVEPEPEPEPVRRPLNNRPPGNRPPGSSPPGGSPSDNRPPANRPSLFGQPPRFERRQHIVTFNDLPPELRYEIYRYYFEDLDPLLHEIAAVRVRQGRNAPESRIVRNLTRTSRGNRRHVLDVMNYPERESVWDPSREAWQREMAAITYEPSADDDALAQLPADGERLGLLRVTRLVRYETFGLFFSQTFRFTHPRAQNIIRSDRNVHHGILAAEAFFTNRPQWYLDLFSDIELDLTAAPAPQQPPPLGEGGGTGEVMLAPRDDWTGIGITNWTNGLSRLPNLANILDRMPFQHLRLNFRGPAPSWFDDRVEDPRLSVSTTSASALDANQRSWPTYPWTTALFNIGRRRRLRLRHHFEFRSRPNRTAEVNGRPYHQALYMIRIIRGFLLEGAQVLRDPYQGIHVTLWIGQDGGDQEGYRQMIIETDDEYRPGSNSIVSHLRRSIFIRNPELPTVVGGWQRAPVYFFANAPPELPPPSPRSDAEDWDEAEPSDVLDQD